MMTRSNDGKIPAKPQRHDSWRAIQGFLNNKTNGARLAIKEITEITTQPHR